MHQRPGPVVLAAANPPPGGGGQVPQPTDPVPLEDPPPRRGGQPNMVGDHGPHPCPRRSRTTHRSPRSTSCWAKNLLDDITNESGTTGCE